MPHHQLKFRMYVDEVGNADLGSSDNPNHRFLSLTGVVIDLRYVQETLHAEMEAIKQRFFGSHPDEPLVLHRKELLNRQPPFSALRDAAVRAEFDAAILAGLRRWEFTTISVCIDKKRHLETYSAWHHNPYHYCMQVLLERFVMLLEGRNGVGDVMAESRGGKEDMRLKHSFARLVDEGTDFIAAERFRAVLTSRQLKVKPKSTNVSGLQLADLVAHPSRNEMLHSQGLRSEPLPEFGARVAEILETKYHRAGTKVWGVGKKMLP